MSGHTTSINLIQDRDASTRTTKNLVHLVDTSVPPFLVLALSEEVSVILPGFGEEAAAYATRLAEALLQAQTDLRRLLDEKGRV